MSNCGFCNKKVKGGLVDDKGNFWHYRCLTHILPDMYDNFLTYGQGGAGFAESQRIDKEYNLKAQAEQESKSLRVKVFELRAEAYSDRSKSVLERMFGKYRKILSSTVGDNPGEIAYLWADASDIEPYYVDDPMIPFVALGDAFVTTTDDGISLEIETRSGAHFAKTEAFNCVVDVIASMQKS